MQIDRERKPLRSDDDAPIRSSEFQGQNAENLLFSPRCILIRRVLGGGGLRRWELEHHRKNHL